MNHLAPVITSHAAALAATAGTGLPGGAEGIRTDGHRGSCSSLRQSMRALIALFQRRSPAWQSSPRRKADGSRRGGDAANTGRIFL
jgi:hypothetical protein